LTNPDQGAGQVAVGDLWWDFATKTIEKDDKGNYFSRARYWYEMALPTLSGLSKVKLEKRIETANAAPSAPSTPAANIGSLKNPLVLDLGKGVTMELVLIPAGTFLMGSPPNELMRGGSETQHSVTISKPFYMGKYDVTQDQYKAIMNDNPSEHKGGKNPVEHLIYDEVLKFCDTLSQRSGTKVMLPTEAQWEYACRAGTKTPFYFGETMNTDQANYNGDETYGNGVKGHSRKAPTPGGSYKPNAFGVYDMHGNVWQWCRDWRRDYPGGAETDPECTTPSSQRVIRGGSFANSPADARSAARNGTEVNNRLGHLGFRVVVEFDTRVGSKIPKTAAVEPLTSMGNSVVDLMRLIDPKRDAVQGQWEMKGNELMSSAANPARLQIPYQPPTEYNFKIVFTRQSGTDCLAQMLPKNTTQFAWIIAGHGRDSYGGFEVVNGQGINDNPTFTKVAITTGKQHTAVVEVRNTGVKAFLDGKLMREYKTDYHDMNPGLYKTNDLTLLGLGAWGSVYLFHTIELTEIGGKGKAVHGP